MSARESPAINALVGVLSDPGNAERPTTFPRDTVAAERPALYAWFADDEGLAALSQPFGVRLPALIYGGQAGATSTHSGTERIATLRSRILGNHLSGNIRSSTFRRTLTALLFQPLGLQLERPGRLDLASNKTISEWMRKHLQVATAPVDDRSTLARVEHDVLARLDPPLNLMGMSSTPVRLELRRLRAALGGRSGRSGPDV